MSLCNLATILKYTGKTERSDFKALKPAEVVKLLNALDYVPIRQVLKVSTS